MMLGGRLDDSSKRRRGLSQPARAGLLLLVGVCVYVLVLVARSAGAAQQQPLAAAVTAGAGTQAAAAGGGAEAGPAYTPRLLSRRTPAWDALHAEGLFTKESGYPRVEPGDEGDRADRAFWEERVMNEFRDGCRRGPNNTKQCMPKLIIMGQFKAGTTALFDMLAQHPDILLPRKLETMNWHERCPMDKPSCVIKEVNGFTRIGDRQRWTERAMLSRYHILPFQNASDERPVLEASPYYLSGMPDSYEDLTRFVRFIPKVKMIALVRNPVDRAFSEYLMFSEPPFRSNFTGCGRGPSRARFELLAAEELAVASSALLEDEHMAHRCLTESSKWQHVPLTAGRNGFRGRLLRWGEYAHYVGIWMRLLGPDQLIVVKNEDMDRDPAGVLDELQRWAGLTPRPLATLHTNLAGCRGSIARGAWDAAKKAQADSGACAGAGVWATQKRVDPGAVEALQAHFAPHNAKLAELTGIDFSSWGTSISPVYLAEPKQGGRDWKKFLMEAAAKSGRSGGLVTEEEA